MNDKNIWVEYDFNDPSTIPATGSPLWYYFEHTGVAHGEYYGDWVFAGRRGFLGGDVTHWQYGNEDDTPPLPPEKNNE
jgi:hypothetical protein